jgi:hypothetical protein
VAATAVRRTFFPNRPALTRNMISALFHIGLTVPARATLRSFGARAEALGAVARSRGVGVLQVVDAHAPFRKSNRRFSQDGVLARGSGAVDPLGGAQRATCIGGAVQKSISAVARSPERSLEKAQRRLLRRGREARASHRPRNIVHRLKASSQTTWPTLPGERVTALVDGVDSRLRCACEDRHRRHIVTARAPAHPAHSAYPSASSPQNKLRLGSGEET